MSANPHRRGLLALLGAGSAAMAASSVPATGRILGALRPGFAGDLRGAELARLASVGARIERVAPLDLAASPHLARLTAALDSNPASIPKQQTAEARAIAALALAYPPEIAAYRSFGAPMRRRLYAELLTRESVRLTAAGVPPPMPPASPGPDA
ncbi:hypothetical protein [Methylobacterium sp. GC_Met_2]|uniref:hypothetical protein n=1 Tax=Methylobacterium sp. GC_Met_2 TaxID=2937376 RepID=UPI00226BBBEA|nr:hypothetical protein [Methylobacterium sp. GC_Met_2]